MDSDGDEDDGVLTIIKGSNPLDDKDVVGSIEAQVDMAKEKPKEEDPSLNENKTE